MFLWTFPAFSRQFLGNHAYFFNKDPSNGWTTKIPEKPKVVQFPKKTNNQDHPNIFCLLLRIPDILQWLVPLTGLQTHLLLHLAANGLRRISSLYSLGLVASGGPNNNGQGNSKSNLTRNQQPTLSKLMKAPQSSVCNMYQKNGVKKMWKQKQTLQLHEHDLHFHLQSCANSSRDSMPSWFTSKTSNNSSAWHKKNQMGDHRNRDTSNKQNDFHLLEAHTNRGSIIQPAICSAAQESSAVFFNANTRTYQ